MSFIERKKAGVHKQYGSLIGRRTEIAGVKYALRQLESRLTRQLKVKDYPNIFYFYGPLGVGKSSLLQAIYRDCEKGELGYAPLCVWVDCRHLAASDAIARETLLILMARTLMSLSEELIPHFQPLLQLWDRYSREDASAAAPLQAPVQPAAAPSAQPAPRANPVRSAYGTMASLQATRSNNVQAIARNVTKSMQAAEAAQRMPVPMMQQLNRDISGELLDLFVKIVDKISASCPVALFIDNYEVFASHDPWFRQVFLPAFQRELVVVVAGEHNLHAAFQHDFGNVACSVRLRPFTRFETELYLGQLNRIQDSVLLEAAQNLTGGLPMSLEMVSSALNQLEGRANPAQLVKFLEFPQEDYGDQLDKYIAYICLDEFPNTDKNLLAVLASLRTFDPQLFQQLSGVMNVRRTLEHLSQRYPFVQPNGAMPEFLSRTLRSYFKQEHEDLYAEISQAAYAYHANLARQHPDDPMLLLDMMYYYFHADSRSAYKHFVQLISHWLHRNLDFCDELCLAALEASIPRNWKDNVRHIASSLGAFRKKDSKGAQAVLAAIASVESAPQSENHYLNYIEAIS